MESYECSGYWWMPNSPNNKVFGTLKFLPTEGAVLELMCFFNKNISFEKNELSGRYIKSTEIILGLNSEGKDITLHNCTFIRRHMLLEKDINILIFKVSFIFVGFHFEKKEDIEFKSISVNYHHLNEWIGISGIKQETKLSSEGRPIELNYNYNPPDKIKVNLKDFCLEMGWDLNSNFDPYELKVRQTSFVKIELQNSTSFDYFLNIFYNIQNLLSLGLRKVTFPLIMEGKNEKFYYNLVLKEGKVYPNIKIFFSALGENEDKNSIDLNQILFSYGDIDVYFENCLNNWFNKKEDLEPVYRLYFATMYNSSMFLQNKFLNLIQALESYHRRIYEGKYCTDEKYKEIYVKMLESIADNIDSDFREKLEGYLRYAHEYSLIKRLKLIIRILQENGIYINPSYYKKDLLISDLSEIRNELTHHDKISEKSKDFVKMSEYVEIMQRIIEACLLLELGLPKEMVIDLVRKGDRRNFFNFKLSQ